MLSILPKYERASRQFVNKNKTSNFFSSNIGEVVKKMIIDSIGSIVCDTYEQNLELPAVVGKSKYIIFRNIKEKAWTKINNWKNNFLSQAGKKS